MSKACLPVPGLGEPDDQDGTRQEIGIAYGESDQEVGEGRPQVRPQQNPNRKQGPDQAKHRDRSQDHSVHVKFHVSHRHDAFVVCC